MQWIANMRLRKILTFSGLILSSPLYASFIESTIGTAVVNDATATYYNPAALTLLKKPQIIGQGSFASFESHFSGQSAQSSTGFTQAGNSNTKVFYYLPSMYMALPSSEKLTVGLAVISNLFNNSLEDNSILRYAQSSNNVQDIDVVPALGIQLNSFISLGACINFSSASFLMEPTTGFPNLNVPDSQSRNSSNGNSVGYDFGVLLKPSQSSLIGINYRSAMTYKLTGTSTFEGTPEVISHHYSFDFWVPARTVLTASKKLNTLLGIVGTVQYIQWNIFNDVHVQGIATSIGSNPAIVDVTIPFHLHNTWLFTLGSQYQVNPQWIIRAAASYIQSPDNNHYQLANGDSFVLGASMGYEFTKNIIVDGSYAHAFIQDENVNINNSRNVIEGTNKSSRDSISLKLTINI
jgi:long-subunit fatty acid transport protein